MVADIAARQGFSTSIELTENPSAETLVEDFSVDASKIREELGFTPTISLRESLEEMIKSS